MVKELNTVQYHISDESYKMVGDYTKEINVRKSMFIDFLIKHYGEQLKNDIAKKLERYNEE